MKRIIIKKSMILVLILVLLSCCFMLTACHKRYKVTVYCGEKSIVYDVCEGDPLLSIGTHQFDITRRGYYFTGFWDKPEGGKKYNEANGWCVSEDMEWDDTFPTALYGQWKPASGYQSEEKQWDRTFSFFTHMGSFSDGYCINYGLNEEEKTLIDGNMDKTVEISFSGRIMAPADSIELFFQDTDRSGYEVYHREKVNITTTGQYIEFSYKAQCSAKIFAGNYKMAFRFRADYFIIASATYVKDVSASFKVL